MKKLLGLTVALALAVFAVKVMAEEAKTAPVETPKAKAEKVCKAKNLIGTALEDCIKAELAKLEKTAK